ncbi:immunity 70 family protein [bacterium]|nr:immunity 70 family protein [bacterium]
MGVNFVVDNKTFNVGSANFLHSFFSTISYNMEPQGWGSRFPMLIKHLYMGRLPYEKLPQLREELQNVLMELEKLPVSRVIWDIEDLAKEIPGGPLAGNVKTAADFFITDVGTSLFDELNQAIDYAMKRKADITIL